LTSCNDVNRAQNYIFDFEVHLMHRHKNHVIARGGGGGVRA